jgi:D-alanine-D-alanine ligase
VYRVAVVYNEPVPSNYDVRGEKKAVDGVLEAVEAVNTSLIELGYDVIKVPLVPPVEQVKTVLAGRAIDLVFNLFEGFCGSPQTEAIVPEIVAELGLPCTGCSAATLMLALDKAGAKKALHEAGIATPRFQIITPETLNDFNLNYPCIVKPRGEDASHGVSENSVVRDSAGLARQVKLVTDFYGLGALVEEFIEGREFNATVLGNTQFDVLPVSEITYSLPEGMPRVLTFEAKWEPGSLYFCGTKPVCPARIPEKMRKTIADTALAVFRLLCHRGYARVDMRMDGQERLNVIEVNPNPDISPGTGAARQAAAAGMTYTEFIARIVTLAKEKDQECPSTSVR